MLHACAAMGMALVSLDGVPVDPRADILALHGRLVTGNPAPHAGALRLPAHGV